MSVLLTDIDIWKKKASLWEFMFYLFENKEEIENILLWNILKKSENDENVDEDKILNFLDKKTKWK